MSSEILLPSLYLTESEHPTHHNLTSVAVRDVHLQLEAECLNCSSAAAGRGDWRIRYFYIVCWSYVCQTCAGRGEKKEKRLEPVVASANRMEVPTQ